MLSVTYSMSGCFSVKPLIFSFKRSDQLWAKVSLLESGIKAPDSGFIGLSSYFPGGAPGK